MKAWLAQGLRVSIDTRHARVMAEALAAGAAVINDVTALAGEAESLRLAAEAQGAGGSDAHAGSSRRPCSAIRAIA